MTVDFSSAVERASDVSRLSQGDVLELPDSVFWLADARWPLTEVAVAAAAVEADVSSGTIIVPDACDAAVMLTQTCDLQRTSTTSPFCQVAPLIEVPPPFVNEVIRGRRPGYVAVPWFGVEGRVADLSRLTTLERSLLVDVKVLATPRSAGEAYHFAECVSRHFTRVALPDAVSEVLSEFLKRIKERNDKNSIEGECIRKVIAFRVEGRPDYGLFLS